MNIFLCGDVMTGRGIDQILPFPSDPAIYEPWANDSRQYIALAELANGPLPPKVNFSYVWGDALEELNSRKPIFRLINLETSVTSSSDYWRGKGINFKMNPRNFACISALGVDCCSLANNHVLDWGYSGLIETISVIKNSGVTYAGAGSNSSEAQKPAILQKTNKERLIVFSFCSISSGVPDEWEASPNKPGVNLIEFSEKTIQKIGNEVSSIKRSGDIAVGSIHWGDNWGYGIPPLQSEFAHDLIDKAGIDIIHGHSSHHVKAMEVYKKKLIMYGCGDFLNDYEGISGYEQYRGDLSLMYFVEIDNSSGVLKDCTLVPMQIKNFRLNRAGKDDCVYLQSVLNSQGERFGTGVILRKGLLNLTWS